MIIMNKKKYTDSEMRKLYEGSFCNEDEMQRYIITCQKKLSEYKDAWPNAMKAALGE